MTERQTPDSSLQHHVPPQQPFPTTTGFGPASVSDDERSSSSDSQSNSPNDQFLPQYYSFFHAAHPCVLPQWALKQRLASNGQDLHALIPVLQFIGSVYAKSTVSPVLKVEAEQAVASIGTSTPITGFDVQAVLLLSIAVYWANEPDKALSLLDKTIAVALELGMHRQYYAYANGNNDPLVEECWRRTWWQVYMTDAHIAGSTSTFPFRTSGIEMSCDLPCDEAEYESGKIPRPRTLQDYDMREFLDDNERIFSSFAEMVGLTRGLDLALCTRKGMTIANAPTICSNADATVTAWRSLLPPSKKDLVREDGTVDELLFKANMIISTYVVELHRQLSTLCYSEIESIAHCSPAPPPESLRGCNTPECQLHTAKVLRAIDGFDDLLTLPTNIATHTPFIICMISNLVIAHLAACRFHYQGQQLKLARERIRLSMGALKVLGEYWTMGQRTYREVGIVAREILGLKNVPKQQQQLPSPVPTTTPTAILGNGTMLQSPPTSIPPLQAKGDLPNEAEMLDISNYLDQTGFPDLQLLDSTFDFCGLFDMNMGGANVNVPYMTVV
ncbi:fungal specific transcription factor domain-containing protein [Aspergillus mulundensis]|uniref:Xylanolytic transcriptional activator regulatory domain-containing protein n=1 Tax=Aspergillus mulundensis TaxID=1810919 RepID=A0A3D8RFK0_9EURO|nr:hypothetical protein DSM5745_07890 [Aspergillus mulundensis]RDW72718.1 hypothetical protein DSM5745_07890 [Aspergillus mulundensis]